MPSTSSCEVWTARISTKDPDAFNVTRKSGDPIFAPSWALLRTALDIRRSGREQSEEEWKSYARTYLSEMQRSYATNRPAWGALLGRPRAVLTCYCTNPERCHRKLLGLVLARLGALYKGELPLPQPAPPKDQGERALVKLVMDLEDED